MAGGWGWKDPSALQLAGLWALLTMFAAFYIGTLAGLVILIIELFSL